MGRVHGSVSMAQTQAGLQYGEKMVVQNSDRIAIGTIAVWLRMALILLVQCYGCDSEPGNQQPLEEDHALRVIGKKLVGREMKDVVAMFGPAHKEEHRMINILSPKEHTKAQIEAWMTTRVVYLLGWEFDWGILVLRLNYQREVISVEIQIQGGIYQRTSGVNGQRWFW